jgi:glycerol-3-phosphate acyltransferase PlsY
LLGSIPTAYIFGRWILKKDIRSLGGGNMGALNAVREIGLKAGAAVLIIDIAKGSAAVLIARYLGIAQIWVFLAGFAAILGHCWPVFLQFRGGKGAATALGVLMVLMPVQFALCLPILVGVILLTSNVNLGVSLTLILLPFMLWIFGKPLSLIIYVVSVDLFLLLRYIPTALRLMKKAGTVRNFLIDKNYTPWQTRKKRPPL